MKNDEQLKATCEWIAKLHDVPMQRWDLYLSGLDLAALAAAYLEAANEWVDVRDALPGENVSLDVTVQEVDDAYDPPTFDYWIERGWLFKGDHWLLVDDGHYRQNVRYELDDVIAYRRPQMPYKRTSEGDI